MKKLMIGAAIALAAVCSQGAQFVWGFNSSMIEGPTDEYSYEGYLDFDMATAMLYIGDTLVATGEMNEDFTFGNLSTSDLATDSTGKVQELDRDDITESFVGQAYKLVLQTNDGKYEIVAEDISSFKSQAAGAGEPNYNYESFVNYVDWAASDWTTVSDPTPEPTSGLLMLVGLAGLALRRKQA